MFLLSAAVPSTLFFAADVGTALRVVFGGGEPPAAMAAAEATSAACAAAVAVAAIVAAAPFLASSFDCARRVNDLRIPLGLDEGDEA